MGERRQAVDQRVLVRDDGAERIDPLGGVLQVLLHVLHGRAHVHDGFRHVGLGPWGLTARNNRDERERDKKS